MLELIRKGICVSPLTTEKCPHCTDTCKARENRNEKPIFKKGLLHHRYRFGLRRNIKVWFCRTFGHRVNNKHDYEWCERCGLAYEEIYHKQK